MKNLIKSIAMAASCLLAVNANAGAMWEYGIGAGNFGGTASTYDGIYTSYNEATSELVWKVDNARRTSNNALMKGFWLVVNDGPNPKSADVNELAIFYGDFKKNTLHAYAYNGLNNSNSWNTPGILIGDYSSDLIENGNTQGFRLDASAINSFTHPSVVASDWKGAKFDDKVGIWFHPVWGLKSETNPAGELTKFSYGKQAWYDVANRTATEVPEPATVALLAAGLLGLAAARRRKA